MNSKSVLNRIMTLLAAADDASGDDQWLQGQDKDGNLYCSPSFELGDDIHSIDADGQTTPIEDGEYEIAIKDASGKDVTLDVSVKDGKISEVETPEQEASENEDDMADDSEAADETEEDSEPTEMSDEKKGALTEDEAKALPNTTDEDEANKHNEGEDTNKPLLDLTAKVKHLEDMLSYLYEAMGTAYPAEGTQVSSLTPSMQNMKKTKKAEDDKPKLDGAPVEQSFSLAAKMQANTKKEEGNYQNNFLSKLYK